MQPNNYLEIPPSTTTIPPSSGTMDLAYGSIFTRRIGQYHVTGKFIGMHKVKGKNIPFMEPQRIQIASDNKYNHLELERGRNRFFFLVQHIKNLVMDELKNENNPQTVD